MGGMFNALTYSRNGNLLTKKIYGGSKSFHLKIKSMPMLAQKTFRFRARRIVALS